MIKKHRKRWNWVCIFTKWLFTIHHCYFSLGLLIDSTLIKTSVIRHCCGVVGESFSSAVELFLLIQLHKRILSSQLKGRVSRTVYDMTKCLCFSHWISLASYLKVIHLYSAARRFWTWNFTLISVVSCSLIAGGPQESHECTVHGLKCQRKGW